MYTHTRGPKQQIRPLALSLVTIALSIPAARISANPLETCTPKPNTNAVSNRYATNVRARFAMVSTRLSYGVFLYDSQETLVYAAGYTYHEGHVYSALQVEIGFVPNEQTGRIYDADNVCIGYLCLSADTEIYRK